MATLLGTGPVLAHQGGWDEILMVLTPIALFAALLWLANSRATRMQDERSSAPSDAPPAPDDLSIGDDQAPEADQPTASPPPDEPGPAHP